MDTPSLSLRPHPPLEVLDTSGTPAFGVYRGALAQVDLTPLSGASLLGRVRGLFTHKRWHYACLATDEVLIGLALVDLGYAANAFVFVVDLQEGGLVAQETFLALPRATLRVNDRPSEGAIGSYRGPGGSIRVERGPEAPSYEIRVTTSLIDLDAVLDAVSGPPPLSLVYRVGEGVSCTQKSNLLPAAGVLQVKDRTWNLGGGFGGLDYSAGFFPRRTAWRWGFGLGRAMDGTPIGFNVADGLTGGEDTENVLWVGREVIRLGAPRFTWDADNPLAPWQVSSADGALDLSFTSSGMHAEHRNLLLVRSDFAQVAGVFSGTVRAGGREYFLERLPGVTEDQRVVW